MPKVLYEGRSLPVLGGETVLDCLLRNGATVSHGCHIGACQACEQRAVSGSPGTEAQVGLDEAQKAKGHFLACQCVPTEDLVIEPPAASFQDVRVSVLERLSDRVLRLRLERPRGFDYRAGQFISLVRGNVSRSYSLASLPQEDDTLELHVKRVRGGKMTTFLFDELRVGDRLKIEGPAGGCVYVAGAPNQPLLLCGTGTGVAPLIGIVRDALHSGHRGPIQLFHGVRRKTDAYAVEALRALQAKHANFSFTVCTLDAADEREVTSGALTDVLGRTVNGMRFQCAMERMFGATCAASPVARSVEVAAPSARGTSAASPVPRGADADRSSPTAAPCSTKAADGGQASSVPPALAFVRAAFVHPACDCGGRGTTRARHPWRGPSTPCKRSSG